MNSKTGLLAYLLVGFALYGCDRAKSSANMPTQPTQGVTTSAAKANPTIQPVAPTATKGTIFALTAGFSVALPSGDVKSHRLKPQGSQEAVSIHIFKDPPLVISISELKRSGGTCPELLLREYNEAQANIALSGAATTTMPANTRKWPLGVPKNFERASPFERVWATPSA